MDVNDNARKPGTPRCSLVDREQARSYRIFRLSVFQKMAHLIIDLPKGMAGI
jgi:hypothetical protein